MLDINVVQEKVYAVENKVIEEAKVKTPEELVSQDIKVGVQSGDYQISALSLKSIQYKRELESKLSKKNINPENLPQQEFTREAFLSEWVAFSEKYAKTGMMLMSSIMQISEPIIEGNKITLELPNNGSKISFEDNMYNLVNGLRKKLNNYALDINVVVNEKVEIRMPITIEDKYKKMVEQYPLLGILVEKFSLELKN